MNVVIPNDSVLCPDQQFILIIRMEATGSDAGVERQLPGSIVIIPTIPQDQRMIVTGGGQEFALGFPVNVIDVAIMAPKDSQGVRLLQVAIEDSQIEIREGGAECHHLGQHSEASVR